MTIEAEGALHQIACGGVIFGEKDAYHGALPHATSTLAGRSRYAPDKGQFAEAVREVHTIAYHEHIRTLECPHIRSNVGGARNRFVEKYAAEHPGGAAGHNQVLGKGEGAPRLQNVINQ